jgi:periplasmic protein TonB
MKLRLAGMVGRALLPAILLLNANALQSQETAPATPPPPQRVKVPEKVAQRSLVKKAMPVYPEKARKNHVQGAVLLQFVVDKSGNVTDLQVVKGDQLLSPPAVEAVKQWQYKPYLLNGEAVEFETQATITFSLSP